MKRYGLPLLSLFMVALLAAGCARPKGPEEHAQWFFEKGEAMIIKSLKKQDATEDQLKQAQSVIDRHESQVTRDLAALFGKHRAMFSDLIGGEGESTLVADGRAFHSEHVKALKSIGAMHDDLSRTIGTELWAAASKYRRQEMEKKFR